MKRTMLDYDDFDFQEFCEEEREIEQQRKHGQLSQSRHNYYRSTGNNHSSQEDNTNAGIVVGVILAIVFIALMIAFSDFLGPILIVGVGAYLLAKWFLS